MEIKRLYAVFVVACLGGNDIDLATCERKINAHHTEKSMNPGNIFNAERDAQGKGIKIDDLIEALSGAENLDNSS